MADHLPGPWALAWEDGKWGVIATKLGKLVAIVGNNPEDGLNDVRKANALLMASAPDMEIEIQELKRRIAELEAERTGSDYCKVEPKP